MADTRPAPARGVGSHGPKLLCSEKTLKSLGYGRESIVPPCDTKKFDERENLICMNVMRACQDSLVTR